MNDDQMQRLREKLVEYEAREREQRQTLRRDILTIAERDEAINTAVRVSLFGIIPSIAWTIFACFFTDWTGAFQMILGMVCFVVPFVIFSTIAGVVGGLFAHWWFAGSIVPVRWGAIAMPLLLDTALLGWLIVITW